MYGESCSHGRPRPLPLTLILICLCVILSEIFVRAKRTKTQSKDPCTLIPATAASRSSPAMFGESCRDAPRPPP